jgi:sugar/nucleoside kinase (ribokinase family)
MTYDIVGMGNAIVDILAHVDDAFLTRHAMHKGGMQLVESHVIADLRGQLQQSRECSGGSVANTIAAMAQRGANTAFLGRVADDALGRVFTQDIRSVGVTFEPVPATEGKPTACCVVCVTPDGERTMNTFIGASAEFTTDDLHPHALEKARMLYVEGYLWSAPEAKDAVRQAIATVRAHGGKIAFSTSDTFCVHGHRDEFLALIREDIDCLFANEDEALALFPDTSIEDIAAQLAIQVEYLAITRSSKPAIVAHKGRIIHSAPIPVANVVDATGAGDLFAAGFLQAVLSGAPLEVCAQQGHALASHIIQQLGARSTTPLPLAWAA